MNEQQWRDFSGVFMPKEILSNKELSLNEKFYLALYLQYGENEYLADKFMLPICGTTTLWKIKKNLRVLGMINQTLDVYSAKQVVLKQKNKGFPCDWCGCKTFALQEHHYPIPKHLGGTETVKICPNCHFEFHLFYKGDK